MKKYSLLIFVIIILKANLLSSQSDDMYKNILQEIFSHKTLQAYQYHTIDAQSYFVLYKDGKVLNKYLDIHFDYPNILCISEPWLYYYDVQYFFVFDDFHFVNEDTLKVIFHSTSRMMKHNDKEYIKCEAYLKKQKEYWKLMQLICEVEECCKW